MPARHLRPSPKPAGEFVDDHDLAVADDVLLIEEHFAADFDRPLDMLVNRGKRHAIHGLRLAMLADAAPSGKRQLDRLFLVVVVDSARLLRIRAPTRAAQR